MFKWDDDPVLKGRIAVSRGNLRNRKYGNTTSTPAFLQNSCLPGVQHPGRRKQFPFRYCDPKDEDVQHSTSTPAFLQNSCPGARKPRSGTATQRTKTSNILKNEPLIPFTATICSTEQRP